MVVLFGWTYFFAPKKPAADANNAAVADANTNTAAPAPAQTQQPQTAPQPAPSEPAPVQTADATPQRKLTIKSQLYEVTFDSKGAVPTSWVLLKNLSSMSEYPIFADGSTSSEKKPLELISQKALLQQPRDLPFRLVTGDQGLDSILDERNYQISVPDETIVLGDKDEKAVEFTLVGADGVEVKKSFVFRGGSYVADLAVEVKKNGQTVTDTKLAIGASIGDQAISHHNFYHIESEAVSHVNGDIKRHQGNYAFTFDANSQASLTDTGTVDWVGVGDAYFAMAAIPAAPAQNVEYKASKFDVETEPFYGSIFKWVIRSPQTSETRHLVTAYLPITADGSVTRIYTGTKDYFTLRDYNDSLSGAVGRNVDIVHFINFSNYFFLRPITTYLSIPILYALHYINLAVQNYGIAIIVFTFLFYMLLFPLRWSQSKSFKKASGKAPKMKEVQDKIKELQKKGVPTDDPRMRALQMEQLKMTKDALPIGGCLPMLLQFPLLIAFYTAITIALEARQASFLWLPDLSAADPWHLLEFGFAFSMILSMKFTPTAATVAPEQQMQQKMMTYLMPVMMLWVMWAAPAGLLLYWFFGNLVSFGQQMVINRINRPSVPPTTEIVNSVPADAKKVKAKLSES